MTTSAAECSECGARLTIDPTQGTPGMPVYAADDGSECPSGVGHLPQEPRKATFSMDDLRKAKATVAEVDARYASEEADGFDEYGLLSREAAMWAGGSPGEIDFAGGYATDDAVISDDLRADVLRLHEAYGVLLDARADGYDETMTQVLLGYSLCPMHQGDYASCFDDDNPECEAIRLMHPVHDT